MQVRRALISVSDKRDLKNFVKTLSKLGIEIISTGGTAKLLQDAGFKVEEVSTLTGFNEILDGRVKTLHPKIHGGLLALRDSKKHMSELKNYGIPPIDMVVVNLYPFEDAVKDENVTLEDAQENIDIGGSTLIRAAAKNFTNVAVVVDPNSYDGIAVELVKNNCALSRQTLHSLAVSAFDYSSEYDSIIFNFLSGGEDVFPNLLTLKYKKFSDLRYGENPYQKAAFYSEFNPSASSIPSAKQLHGKNFSYNNLLDIDAAIDAICGFEEPSAAVLKHTNPCGLASADSLEQAYILAHDCDTISAYGSIVSFNQEVDLSTVKRMKGHFIEVVVAPGFAVDALKKLKQRKNIRLLEVPIEDNARRIFDVTTVRGGVLVQTKEKAKINEKDLKVVSNRKPNSGEIESMLFAWKVNTCLKSNSIALCIGKHTVGIGAGQMSRVDAVKIAVTKAGEKAKGSVMSSDAFFPFRDGIDEAAKGGVTAVIQAGGSIRDQEVINAVNGHDMAMVFTGTRCFKH